ncbi:FUSC family protein [Christiangramia salexigens]|uniref:FUSC family protein n=1 Tax=Christiangramia salexigens TaxID=1913577 RepID=A0A1L3J3A2_9FLAO|nr:FUSC family membrane protein [Christiangramia salexigens]APG59604.1 FUSC family protein [Christiangramia salexigens]
MTQKLISYKEDLFKFLRSTDFSKAIVLTIAILVPVSLFYRLDFLEIGISIAMGCLLSSPSDVTGSFKHKVLGILSAAGLGSLSFMIAGYSSSYTMAVIPMLLIMMFSVSYLSVYGFRASLVTFSGLLAVVLSFANLSSGIEIWQKALLIAGGGIWYLMLSTLWYFLKPKRPTEELLAETMEITADYLRTRMKLLETDIDAEKIQKELFTLQNELNEHHESLREILISSRKDSGSSGYTRKRLLIFIDLVDILEFAMANPIDYERMQSILKDDWKQLRAFSNFSLQMAAQLDRISQSIYRNSRLPDNAIPNELAKTREALKKFRESIDVTKKREAMLLLRNFFDYQTKQAQKINSIDRILRNIAEKRKIFYKNKDLRKFLTPQEYSFKTLETNFNFNSAIFRHALRLALVVVAGYFIGEYFSVQNSYWILLTIVVIMRPNYGLTKERTKKRITGTLIGGAIAIGIVMLTQNPMVYAVLGLLSLTLAFSLIQRNYTTAAIFITLSIIFIYALLQPEVLNVIQYRVIDTLIGAGLAALGNVILWPKWEFTSINATIFSSINSNLEYLSEIDKYYHDKKEIPASYKLARKKAFMEMGNLSGSFQRMAQEPKSKQMYLSLVYNIVGLNQTFLSALASLGSYIRTHPTTKASADFELHTRSIRNNLENALRILEHKELKKDTINIKEAGETLHRKFDELARERDLQIEAGQDQIEKSMRLKLQEAHLITGQLEWLMDISEKLEKKIKELNQKDYE